MRICACVYVCMRACVYVFCCFACCVVKMFDLRKAIRNLFVVLNLFVLRVFTNDFTDIRHAFKVEQL